MIIYDRFIQYHIAFDQYFKIELPFSNESRLIAFHCHGIRRNHDLCLVYQLSGLELFPIISALYET